MTRLHPYTLVFDAAGVDAERWTAFEHELDEAGIDPFALDAFLAIAPVAALIDELAHRDDPDAPIDAATTLRFAPLIYHAFHFWRAGARTWRLPEDLVREWVRVRPVVGDWNLAAPATAGYVQLPRRTFWARPDPDEPAEDVDGLFWVQSPVGPTLRILAALGVRPDRPGFTVVAFETPLPAPPAAHFASSRAMTDRDFANILPGGELSGFHGISTPAEILTLLTWTFHALARSDASSDIQEVALAEALPPGQLREPNADG